MSYQHTKFTGEYANTDVKYADFSNAPSANVSVMTTGNCTVSTTNSSDVDSSSIWIDCTLTDNACSITGPVTGVRITGTGDGEYCIRVL